MGIYYFMKKILMLTPLLMLLNIAAVQSQDCEIPGKTMHWIADYCMLQAETDDFLNATVQTCFEKQKGYTTKDTCENKKKYKMKMCTHLAGLGRYNSNAETCFKDKTFIPPTVKNDGV